MVSNKDSIDNHTSDRIELLKKYLQFRRDTGEEGFWIDGDYPARKSPPRFNIKKGQKDAGGQRELEEIEKAVLICKKCPLGLYRLNPCFGKGDPEADLMLVGEGPGYEEDHQGIVFVGRAGKLLDRILNNVVDLNPSRVYITNIVKCHPMKDCHHTEKRGNDRPPNELESQTCISLYLNKQINLIRPKIITTLGSPATKTLLNTDKGITSLRGKVFDMKYGEIKIKFIPTYHPAYILRNPSMKNEVFEDFKLIRAML